MDSVFPKLFISPLVHLILIIILCEILTLGNKKYIEF